MKARMKVRGKLVAVVALAMAGTLALAACSGAPAGSADSSMNGSGSDSMMGDAGNDSMASTTDGAYKKITADEAQAMMDSGSPTVVDVRTAKEYADGHIPGAINIPVESIGADKPAELDDANADLIVYCRTGVRSKQASDKLVELGYQHVNDMGGIVDWPYGTVAGSEPDGA